MRKNMCVVLCAVVLLTSLAGCGTATKESDESTSQSQSTSAASESAASQTDSSVQEEITLQAADAAITGQGIDETGNSVDTAYISNLQCITNFGTDSTITYTVPENSDGVYDIYVDYGKSPYAVGTTQASLIVNGSKEYLLPAAIESCSQDYSDLFSMGKFLMANGVALKAGDTLTVHGKPGFEMEYNGKKVSSMTAVGNIYLYPAGSAVAVGYDGGKVQAAEEPDATDVLSGKNIVWLGSSVTFGAQSGGYSMADAIADNHKGTNCYKYAISGTTLANDGNASYVERLKDIDKDMDIDLMVVQLSTNDATQGKTLGAVSEGKELASFDDTTVIGAMEYIIAYTQQTWNCPVVFYTGTHFENDGSAEYNEMVQAVLELQSKWDIGVVNLWDNEEMTALYGTEQYQSYMADEIHPNRKGYVEWWTPVFEEDLSQFIAQ